MGDFMKRAAMAEQMVFMLARISSCLVTSRPFKSSAFRYLHGGAPEGSAPTGGSEGFRTRHDSLKRGD